MPDTRRWSLKRIALISSLVVVLLALIALGAMVVGHGRIVEGTTAIEQVTVPNVVESSRIARNLEHIRRYGDMALLAGSTVERSQAQLSMTLIATHPSMQSSDAVIARVNNAISVLDKALAMAPIENANAELRKRAFESWKGVAEELNALADEIMTQSSQRAALDAHQIQSTSSHTLTWLIGLVAALSCCVLAFAAFMFVFVARPLQRTALALDELESGSGIGMELMQSPVWEIDRLRRVTLELSIAMDNAKQARLELERLATIDGLSGLCNRRHFSELAQFEWQRTRRYGRPLAFLMVDIDHFKSINDKYGHAAGDQVIVHLARLMEEVVRSNDQVARVGGEEFAVIMPETERDAAICVAQRLCVEVSSAVVNLNNGQRVQYTVSVGAAIYDPGDERFDALMQRADTALYQAKHNGRNQVSFAEAGQSTAVISG